MEKKYVDVLVIEDSKTLCIVLGRMLEENGFSYTTAASAYEALELLKTIEPRMLIADYVMPGMDGVELLRSFCQTNVPPFYPLLFSGAENPAVDKLALSSGFAECIHKSEGLDYLLARVREVLMGDNQKKDFVLIVEDSISQATRLRYMIEKAGLPCQLARDGRDALDLMAGSRPQLVVSDIRMPNMDGFALCTAMKADSALRSIPVVLMTSLASLKDITGALQVGADYYFPKDADDSYIVSKLKKLFGASSREEGDASAFTVAAMDKEFSLSVSRERLFDFLFSTCELAQHQNLKLCQQQRELQRRQENLAELALTDELTGLKNRRAFFKAADREFRRFQRYHSPFAVMMMDVDCFKTVNDTYGHAVGDHVIRLVGKIIGEMLRNVDVLARIGGDEFVIILVEVDAAIALEVANRIRNVVSQAKHDDLPAIDCLTISLGMTLALDSDHNFEAILKRADDALYEAKHSGRNLVRIHPDESASPASGENSCD